MTQYEKVALCKKLFSIAHTVKQMQQSDKLKYQQKARDLLDKLNGVYKV